MNFINHKQHKTKEKNECFECIKELEILKEEYLETQVAQILEDSYHSHGRR